MAVGVEFSGFRIMKIEKYYLVSSVDSLLPRLEERCPSNWDVPPSHEQYIKEIRMADFISLASVNPTATESDVPISEVTELSIAKWVKPMAEEALTLIQTLTLEIFAVDRWKGIVSTKKKACPPPPLPLFTPTNNGF